MAVSNLRCAGHLRHLSVVNAAKWRKVTVTHQGILGPACNQSKYQDASRVPQAQGLLHCLERGSPFQRGFRHSEITEGAFRNWKGVLNRQRGLHQSSLRSSAFGEAGTHKGIDPVEGSSEDVEGVTVKHRFLHNEGVKIHYVEAGNPNGKLAVLLHGFPSFWYGWLYQIKPLADAGYHVVVPDMRGYNLSDKPSSVADYGRVPCTSDVKLLMEKNNGGQPAVLIAHDWGGAVAWHFVRSYPRLVSHLVTLNIPETSTFGAALKNNKEQRKKSWYIAFFQIPFLPEWIIRRKDFEGLKRAYGGSKPRSRELLNRHVDAFSRPGALTASINYYRAGGRGYWKSESDPPQRVELPVKVIWGEEDVALGKELATPPKDLVPNQEVVFLPKVSHWCMWDEPAVVNREILTFLARDV